MQSQLFSCSVCYTEFDNKERKPKIIPGCGHTICLFCLEKILGMTKPMCPLDRKSLTKKIEDYSTNIIVLQLIDEKEKAQGGCPLHNEPNNLVCLDDKCVICKYCAEYGDHKGHKIKHVNDVQKEANGQRMRLKDMIDALEEEEQAIYRGLDENRESLFDENKKRYAFLKEEIARREQESLHAIQGFFVLKKLMVSQKLKPQLKLKEALQKKAQELSNINNYQAFFNAFKEESDEIAAATAGHLEEDKSVKEKVLGEIEEFRSKFMRELEKLEENVMTFVKQEPQKILQDHDGINLGEMDEEGVLETLRLSKKLGRLVVSPMKEDEKRSEVRLPEECNKITLDFSKKRICDDALLAISWVWNKFEKIQDVKIDISDKNIPVSELLESCSPLFYIISTAEVVELILASCDVTDEHLKEILDTKLSCIKHLKGIRLQLRGTKITDKGVRYISEFIRARRERIENFYLNASATQISDSSIEQLCTSFNPNMKNFSLVLNSTNISDKTVELVNQFIVPLSENWKVLAFHFFDSKVSDASILKLLTSLREKVSTLTHFFFEIGKTKVTEKSMKFLITDILPNLRGLETFMLGAASLKLDGVIIQDLLETFNCDTFKNLEYFALSLDNVPFSDKHLEYFAKNILVEMKKIESLIFTLTGASLTDAGLESFFLALKDVAEKIKFFNLRLVKNVEVSDKSIDVFDKQVFPLFTSLETFTFQVDRTQVSENGKSLLSAMEKQVLSK